MAAKSGKAEGGTDENGASLGPPNPPIFAERVEETVRGDDEVSKAYRRALQADTPQEEAKAHAEIVKASPDAADTPSGHALLETAGIADDVERGEEYTRVKRSKRWGL